MKTDAANKPKSECVVPGMSMADYNSAPALRNSHLGHLLRSAAHYKYHSQTPLEPTRAMEFGTLFHALIEDPEALEHKYVVAPDIDGRTKAGKEAKEALLKSGKAVISIEDHNAVINMLDSVMSHPKASELLKLGISESSYFWTDPNFLVDCKCRADYSRAGQIIVDIKTTEDASFRAFQRSIATFSYHRQAAFYLDGITAATDKKHDKFVLIAVEKKPPYGVAVYALDEATIEAGRSEYFKALRIYAECKKADKWPGYSSEIEPINLPNWAWPSEDT